MDMFSGRVVGRSFREWTTNATDLSYKAFSNSFVNKDFSPICKKYM